MAKSLSFTDEGKSCHSHAFANMSFNAICGNKILAKNFEFTVAWSAFEYKQQT